MKGRRPILLPPIPHPSPRRWWREAHAWRQSRCGHLQGDGGRAHASMERSTGPLVNQNASDISTYQVSYLLHPLHPSPSPTSPFCASLTTPSHISLPHTHLRTSRCRQTSEDRSTTVSLRPRITSCSRPEMLKRSKRWTTTLFIQPGRCCGSVRKGMKTIPETCSACGVASRALPVPSRPSMRIRR